MMMRHSSGNTEKSLRDGFSIHSTLKQNSPRFPDSPIVSFGRMGCIYICVCVMSYRSVCHAISVRFDLYYHTLWNINPPPPPLYSIISQYVWPDGLQGKILRLGVKHLEVKIVCGLGKGRVPVPIRLVASNPTGYAVRVETYFEVSVSRPTFRR